MKYITLISIIGCDEILKRPNIYFCAQTEDGDKYEFKLIKPTGFSAEKKRLERMDSTKARIHYAGLDLRTIPQDSKLMERIKDCAGQPKGKEATLITEKDLETLYKKLIDNYRKKGEEEEQYYNPNFITLGQGAKITSNPAPQPAETKSIETPQPQQPQSIRPTLPKLEESNDDQPSLFDTITSITFTLASYFVFLMAISLIVAAFSQSLTLLITNPFYPLTLLLTSAGLIWMERRGSS